MKPRRPLTIISFAILAGLVAVLIAILSGALVTDLPPALTSNPLLLLLLLVGLIVIPAILYWWLNRDPLAPPVPQPQPSPPVQHTPSPSSPTWTSPTSQARPSGFSRRIFVIGGPAAAGVGGFWLLSRSLSSLSSSARSSPSSTRSPSSPAVGTLLYTYRGHSDYVRAVAWAPKGDQIASGSSDRTVQVWQGNRQEVSARRGRVAAEAAP